MKDYPPRPKEPINIPTIDVCECGHDEHEHKTSDFILLSNPPQCTYLECMTCMCPKYNYSHHKLIPV